MRADMAYPTGRSRSSPVGCVLWINTMAKRHAVHAGCHVQACASVTGLIQQRRLAYLAATDKQPVCRVILEVEDRDIPVIARGDVAHTLSQYESGEAVHVEGDLIHNRWGTCDGRSEREMAVEARKVERP